MGVRSNVVIVLASLCLFACGSGSAKNGGEAKGPETNPWADYKGTYATAAGASGSPSARAKIAKTEAAQSVAPKEAPKEATAEAAP